MPLEVNHPHTFFFNGNLEVVSLYLKYANYAKHLGYIISNTR